MEPEKKESILKAAAEVFALYGFRKTSMDEIADKAQVAKGTLYLMCQNKEDLFHQVLYQEITAWQGYSAQFIDDHKPADQNMMELVAAELQYISQNKLLKELIIRQGEDLFEFWISESEELQKLATKNIGHLLENGIQQGIFRTDLPKETLSQILQDIEVSTLLMHVKKGATHTRIYATVMVDLILNGVKKR